MFERLKLRVAVKEYIKKYPYKWDSCRIPTNDGTLSVSESNYLKQDLIEHLFEAFAKTETHKPQINLHLKNIQFVLSVGSHNVTFHRYIAFDRTNGTPVLIENNKGTAGVLCVTVLGFGDYNTLLNDLIELYNLPNIRQAVWIDTYCNYSMQDLLKINAITWCDYILPIKEHYNDVVSIETNDTLCETTIEDLVSLEKQFAIYQGKICPLAAPGGLDYVMCLSCGEKNKLVDIREISDICEKQFYVEIKKKLFKVDMVGGSRILLEYGSWKADNYEPYGLTWRDPRGMGPAWEGSVDLVEAVKYKKVSVYEVMRKNLNML